MGECQIDPNNFVGGTHAKSEAECISQCSDRADCNHYTWYSKDSQTISEGCLFFSSCKNLESCSSGGCFTGSLDCIGFKLECPDDFIDFDPNYEYCYRFESENSLPWGDANRACMAYGPGGSLVSIHSEEETTNILSETLVTSWIGLYWGIQQLRRQNFAIF